MVGMSEATDMLCAAMVSRLSAPTSCSHCSKVEARAAAWHGRRHALAERLRHGVWCPECYSDDAHVVALDEKTTSQPWCTECDVEMGGICDDVWPRCLAWTDEQAAEVEQWLQGPAAPMPGVLAEETAKPAADDDEEDEEGEAE